MALLLTVPDTTTSEQAGLRKELGLGDLVLAQVLCVVGSTWVGIAAKLGRAHVAFWLGAMLLYTMTVVTGRCHSVMAIQKLAARNAYPANLGCWLL